MKRSFTLIELLVAVSIFVIVCVISLATVVTLTRNRAKAEPIINTQQSGNLAMEMMANEVGNAATVYLEDYLPTITGHVLHIPLTDYERYFKLRIWDNGYRDFNFGESDGTTCPEGERCAVMMIDSDTSIIPPEEIRSPALTSSDVNVKELKFTGCDSDDILCSNQKPYVTIHMVLQSAWATANDAPLTLHTTVVPQL